MRADIKQLQEFWNRRKKTTRKIPKRRKRLDGDY